MVVLVQTHQATGPPIRHPRSFSADATPCVHELSGAHLVYANDDTRSCNFDDGLDRLYLCRKLLQGQAIDSLYWPTLLGIRTPSARVTRHWLRITSAIQSRQFGSNQQSETISPLGKWSLNRKLESLQDCFLIDGSAWFIPQAERDRVAHLQHWRCPDMVALASLLPAVRSGVVLCC